MEYEETWLNELTIEDLPNQDLQIIAGVVGLDIAIKLLVELAGFDFTIPKNSLSHLKNKYIAKKYDGTKSSRFELGKRFGVSERTIFRISKEYNFNQNQKK